MDAWYNFLAYSTLQRNRWLLDKIIDFFVRRELRRSIIRYNSTFCLGFFSTARDENKSICAL
jgi:hypothetical protein